MHSSAKHDMAMCASLTLCEEVCIVNVTSS